MKNVAVHSAFIAEVIPVILILLFILYTKSTVEISYTVLGKLFAICLIVGYTIYDVLYGLVMCMMVILYYQLDYVENMQNISNSTNNMHIPDISTKPAIHQDINANIDTTKSSNKITVPITDPMNDSFNDDERVMGNDILSHGVEGMTTYYDFQKNHCRNNQLHYKEFPIRNDAVEHVFPEIKFNGDTCNPCDPNCNISFVNRKIDTESQLVLPKSSNDSFFDSWKEVFGKENHFFPRLADITPNFAIFT